MRVLISAVICTVDLAESLRASIQSLVHQTLPRDQYEIIVLDNASSDHTAGLVKDEFGRISNLRYVYEPMREGIRKS